MSAAGRLLERLDELTGAIERGRVPADLRADVIAFLQLKLEARRGRADAGTHSAAARWAANHERVRQALGAAPLDYRLDGLVAVVHRRLQGALGRRAIREHLVAMREKVGDTEP